ncbi:MAG: DJ-1/PfpI family protein [Spirochaetes bacterium]|nr:DJ-1/PfpI family protein [Spirochaetota bacterium]
MVLMPISDIDFEPSETSVPWKIMKDNDIEVVFATPSGKQGKADPRLLSGDGLGIWKKILMADRETIGFYSQMEQDPRFRNPLKYEDIDPSRYSAILLPGGHAPGMKSYLESEALQKVIVHFFNEHKPVGAICHGVLACARSIDPKTGKSVLYHYKTTALLKRLELIAYYLTCLWLKDYYRTYPITVEDEVISFLADRKNFIHGNSGLFRDSMKSQWHGFTVRDRNYLSSRWPGDVHRFAFDFLKLIR